MNKQELIETLVVLFGIVREEEDGSISILDQDGEILVATLEGAINAALESR